MNKWKPELFFFNKNDSQSSKKLHAAQLMSIIINSNPKS